MATLMLPKDDLKRMIRRRRRLKLDRYDEVWDGVYVMAPIAGNDHQWLGGQLAHVFLSAFDPRKDVRVYPGANVSDQPERWTKNYRVPDVLVFLPGNPAEDRDTHWFGGPDFAVEVVSPGDRSRKKLAFYSKVGVRELLIVERDPWRLDFYRAIDSRLQPVCTLNPGASESFVSQVLPLDFRLLGTTPRPQIEATRQQDGRVWLI